MRKVTIIALHLYYGGIEKYISYLCKMFENDYEVEVITVYKKDEKPAFEFSKKIKIAYLTNSFPYTVSIKKLIKEYKFFKVFREFIRRVFLKIESIYKLRRAIKNLKTDIVITTRIAHNKLVNKYLKDSNIVKIATEHNYHNNDKKYIDEVINSITNFDYFIHCTDELYNFYKPLIVGPKNIKINNPVYINNNFKSKLNNFNIISVGRLSDEKGYLDLIEVMKSLNKINNKIKLTICGDGYQRLEIEQKIKQYNLSRNVKVTGFIYGKELSEIYKNASLYVMPSKSESFGLVLLEAMHYGLPCIAFDSASGARELLKNGIGILIKDRNINEMAEKINELLNNRDMLKKYSEKSINYVSNYSLDKIYKQWKKILK